MKTKYEIFNGHIVVVDTDPSTDAYKSAEWSITCATSSVSYTLARAVTFMTQCGIQNLSFDGYEIKRKG